MPRAGSVKVFPECSTDYARYRLLPPHGEDSAVERPEPPGAISVSNPLNGNSGLEHGPTFRVEGVNSGDTVRLHRDSQCLLPLGDLEPTVGVVAKEGSVLIAASNLFVDSYTVYASTTRNGIRSDCSTVFAPYEVLAPKPEPPQLHKAYGEILWREQRSCGFGRPQLWGLRIR